MMMSMVTMKSSLPKASSVRLAVGQGHGRVLAGDKPAVRLVGSSFTIASRISWKTPSLSGTNGYFQGTPSRRRAEMRG